MRRFLRRLEEANKREFGGRAPDCCSGKGQVARGKVSRGTAANKKG